MAAPNAKVWWLGPLTAVGLMFALTNEGTAQVKTAQVNTSSYTFMLAAISADDLSDNDASKTPPADDGKSKTKKKKKRASSSTSNGGSGNAGTGLSGGSSGLGGGGLGGGLG